MFIYKITNITNNKVYIGQTIRPVKKRFQRHLTDAIKCKLDTHLARAIRKYGKESFVVEQIDSATSQEELTQKEIMWIKYYNSTQTGYNETDSEFKCGGNTYHSKTEDEMEAIKEKIRKSKIGQLNPMSRKIKKIDILNGTYEIFDTIIGCAKSCGIKGGKTSLMSRLSGRIKSPYKGQFLFEYIDV